MKKLATAVLLSAWLVPAHALASGFASARFGGEHGNPVATNPTAIYYNPAGIAGSEGVHVFVDGTFAFRGQTYTHWTAAGDTPEPGDAKGANSGTARSFNLIPAPAIAVTAKLKDFAFGLGMFVPFGGSGYWDQNQKFAGSAKYPGPVDGPQRWYLIDGSTTSIYFSAAAAYAIPKTGLSIGISGNLISSSIHTTNARTTDGSNDIASEGRSLVDVSGLQGSFGVGAMFEAIPKKLWIGASYQSRPNVSGGMVLKGHAKNNFAGTKTDDLVNVSQDLPDVFRFGVRFAARRDVELRLFGDFTRWSSFKNQCGYREGTQCDLLLDGSVPAGSGVLQNLPRDWKDSFGVRAGASFWVRPGVELFTGAGFDQNSIPDKTHEPAYTDFDAFSTAVGGRVRLGQHLQAALSYTHFFCMPRDTAGQSQLASPPNGAYQQPSNGPDAGGLYTQWIGLVNAYVEAMF